MFPIFLKRSLAFPLLLFSSSVMHYSLKKGFMSPLFFGTLNLVGCAFPFLPFFSLLFFFQLFVKPPQVTTLPSCFSFSLGTSLLLNFNLFMCKWSEMNIISLYIPFVLFPPLLLLLYVLCHIFYWLVVSSLLTCKSNFNFLKIQFSSVQFSRSVVSDSLPLHESQHARPPCPSPTPGVHSNSCPLSRWCHPAISSSVVPFSSCPQSLPVSGSFPMSQIFAWGGQSIGVSASASILPMNTQDWSPLGWTGWISLQSKGLSRVFSNTTVEKHQFFGSQLSLWSNSHIHTWPQEKP